MESDIGERKKRVNEVVSLGEVLMETKHPATSTIKVSVNK